MKYPEACLERVPGTSPSTVYFASNAGDLLKRMLSATGTTLFQEFSGVQQTLLLMKTLGMHCL